MLSLRSLKRALRPSALLRASLKNRFADSLRSSRFHRRVFSMLWTTTVSRRLQNSFSIIVVFCNKMIYATSIIARPSTLLQLKKPFKPRKPESQKAGKPAEIGRRLNPESRRARKQTASPSRQKTKDKEKTNSFYL